MNNYSVGTLVILNCSLPLTLEEHSIVNGVIGEIVARNVNAEVGQVTVDFPSHKSKSTTGLWNCYTAWLVPISNPDLDVGDVEQDSDYLKEPDALIDKYFEEHA